MNWNKWNSLPPNIQKVLENLSGDYAQKLFSDYWSNALIKDQQIFVKDFGGTCYHWSAEDIANVNQLWKPIIEKWITEMNSKGYPAQEIVQYYWQLEDQHKVPPPF